MKFWYMESQKPTRDERSWVIGMAEVGFNINYNAFHFDIHKTIAYRIINRFVQTKLARDPPRSGRQNKKIAPLEERFIQITPRRVAFLTANLLCITSRNCLWYVSVHQKCPEPSPNHVESVQNIDILSFFKNILLQVLRLHTNDIFQYLVLDKIVIAFTAKNTLFSLCYFNFDFCNKYAYL